MAIQGIPQSMQAAQVVEINKPYKVHSVPTPTTLKPYEILVRIAVASFCHTDMMVLAGIFPAKLPITGSHEGVGTVVLNGSDVNDFKLGDRVLAGLVYGRCNRCSECKSSEPQYCKTNGGTLGLTLNGSFAEYQVVDAREAAILPDNLSFQSAAPLACAGLTVYGGLKRLNLKPGEWLAIVGAGGGLGHLAVQMAKAMNLKVLALDARDEALQLAKESGADVLVDARESMKSVVSKVLSATGGTIGKEGIVNGGADGTMNVSDHESAATTACTITKMHGTMVQIAQPDHFTVPFTEIIMRDIRILGSLIASRAQAKEMLRLVADHKINVKTNAFYGFGELGKLVELAYSGKMTGKAVLVIDEEAVQREKARL